MGFSLKSVVKAVTAPIVAPVAVTVKALDKVGLTDTVKDTAGIDLNNLSTVAQQTGKLEGSTGSSSFKTAFFDAGKIGIAAAGGAGALTNTQAAGGFLLASKIQNGGGISVGDLGSLTGLPTGLGGVDLGGINIVKPKTTAPLSDVFPDFFSDEGPGSVGGSSNNKIVMIALGAIAFIGLIYILIRKKR